MQQQRYRWEGMERGLRQLRFSLGGLVIAGALGTASVVAAATATVSVGTVAGQVGQEVTVPVRLTSSPIRSLSAASFDIGFDAARLTYVRANRGANLEAAEVIFPEATASSVSLAVADLGLETDPGFGLADGEIVKLTFQIKSTVTPGGTIPLVIGNLDALDQAGAVITGITGGNGSLSVVLRGDLSGDGRLTYADLRLAFQMLLRQVTVDLARADLNGDGALTLADIRAMMRLISGR